MEHFYDVVVVGGGPAGLAAALYLARACYRVLVLEKEQFGGQITITSEVVNYPGVKKVSGVELTETMRRQAESFGAEFLLAEATRLELDGDVKIVHTSRGELRCFGVLLATGAHPRKVGFQGEAEFQGHGVAYCATCDGEFFTGKDVFVIGGGFAAAEESVFLTKYARHVTILIRKDDFSCAPTAAEAAKSHEKITVLPNTVVEEVAGDSVLQALRYRNNLTGQVTEYRPPEGETFGVFVFAGYEPETGLVREFSVCNDQGYVMVDSSQRTSIPGLFAAGDVCVKELRQVVTAVGDGATAATELERYAAVMQKKTGIIPVIPKRIPQKEAPAGQKVRKEEPGGLFSEDMKTQLNAVFGKMARPLILELSLDDRPVSEELKLYMETLASMTDRLTIRMSKSGAEDSNRPLVRVLLPDGTETGIAFHGVPGGHEFTSFVLGLYNAAGPGQALEAEAKEAIDRISRPVHMQILVSLSCTMCPELVTAAQRIAAENPLVSAEVYDLNHFPDLKEKYQVMSVPCLVINGDQISFGKKNVRQVLELLEGSKGGPSSES
ncbi:FAD-dependent oxidoreductase [Cuneatibacter sp. NSJ-177]|uniref:FAD-dependent oxidoreductase n=1 Tax=Cuneatibacter sp. NSJ-177 TaxID=2931401 RepID=UPI001FD410EA|nr:FAD-dependent oxidoreductase [Cuneatibacter sp. NSJ-177]MCJ7834509.1 FAD-dependent oxidoreductase [Cuneatibacter sp. NSJ-177]